MPSGIYVIENRANGKVYVGSAVSLERRKKEHLRALGRKKHHSIKLQRAWDKYGAENFTFRALLVCTKPDLIFFEQRAIDAYDAARAGYNIAAVAGSTLGVNPSAETRAKQSAAGKGKVKSAEHQRKITESQKRKVISPKERERLREIAIGNTNCVGRVISAETRKKIADAHCGVPHSKERRDKAAEGVRRWWAARKKKALDFRPEGT